MAKKYNVCLDVGGTKVLGVIFDENREIVYRLKKRSKGKEGQNVEDVIVSVVEEMLKIPFGATTTYGAIAATLARCRGIVKMSARAVGGAVGWNPICLIIPCHRVMGANGAITGYGGGIHNKIALLKHEGHMIQKGMKR